MKKTKSIVSILLIIVIIVVAAFHSPQSTTAANRKSAWKSLSDVEIDGLITICQNEMLSLAFSEYMYNRMRSGQTKTLNFSKAAKRRYVLKYFGCYYGNADRLGNSAELVSKYLFGRSTSKIKVLYGDIGANVPHIGYGERANVYKKGSKYESEWGMYMIDESVNPSTYEEIGLVTYNLKRTAKSKFGWIIKSVKLERF